MFLQTQFMQNPSCINFADSFHLMCISRKLLKNTSWSASQKKFSKKIEIKIVQSKNSLLENQTIGWKKKKLFRYKKIAVLQTS
jgi:hypothetical protein